MKCWKLANRIWPKTGLLLILLSAAAGGGMSTAASAQTTPTLTTLHSFSGSDGTTPYAGLIADASGALYGTTQQGGATGTGTVFKLAPPSVAGGAWTETVLYSFNGCISGCYPTAGLIADAAGNLYGVNGLTAFKLTPPAAAGGTWTETVLYSFNGCISECPYAGLIADASGALYGTSEGGGAGGTGIVFKLTPPATAGGTWIETVLSSFGCYPYDGCYPYGGVIADASGALYGSTVAGGSANAGTVFKLTPPAVAGGAWTRAVIYSFAGHGDGGYPQGSLIFDASGNLYGTTRGFYDDGTVFKLTPTAGGAWSETVLHTFTGSSDGANSTGGLIFDAAGALYGTTQGGGPSSAGTLFKLAPPTVAGGTWTETVLYSFTGGADGANPFAGLIADATGALYGTTLAGGASNAGTAFRLALSATFTGVPGQTNCIGQSISFMAKKYGGIAHAADSLGYSTVAALQNAVLAYCGG